MRKIAFLFFQSIQRGWQFEGKVTVGRKFSSDESEERFVGDSEITQERRGTRAGAAEQRRPLQSCHEHCGNCRTDSKQFGISSILFCEPESSLVLP